MNKTIMIVEDEQSYHDLYSMMLEDTEYRIVNAYDGDEALTKLEKKKPDLMIIDLILDMMTGDTLFLYLKSIPEYEDIPVIITSSISTRPYRTLKDVDPDLIFLDKSFTTKERFVNEIRTRIGH